MELRSISVPSLPLHLDLEQRLQGVEYVDLVLVIVHIIARLDTWDLLGACSRLNISAIPPAPPFSDVFLSDSVFEEVALDLKFI